MLKYDTDLSMGGGFQLCHQQQDDGLHGVQGGGPLLVGSLHGGKDDCHVGRVGEPFIRFV